MLDNQNQAVTIQPFWRMPILPLLGLGFVILMFTAGCYPDWPEHSGTAEVEGEVILDGFPIEANVVFLPAKLKSKSGKVMALAYGKSDARGMFKMKYRDGSRDVVAGTYHVLISSIDPKSKLTDREAIKTLIKLSEKHGNGLSPTGKIIVKTQSAVVSRAELLEEIDRYQVVPSFYNRESNLKYEVVASPGIVRTKFELSSIDPLLAK